jgi:threonyl-tRNA synthetase
VRVLSLSEKVESYAAEVASLLTEQGFRATADIRNEKLGLKVREAEIAKVPYMAVVGEREAAARSVSLRRHGHASLTAPQPAPKSEAIALEALVEQLKAAPTPS